MLPQAMLRNSRKLLIILAGLLALAALGWTMFGANGAGKSRQPLALFGTVPIYWGEAASLEETLAGTAEPHWAREVLEQRFELAPLDTLDEANLAQHSRLLMAQPRALSPSENVALDNWVSAGGHVVIFADPLLTLHSRFGLGDRRRPQDVILLSPILARWGLELQFDDTQAEGVQITQTDYGPLPIELIGTLVRSQVDSPSSGQPNCVLANDGLIATCPIDSGSVLIVADATVFDVAEAADTLLQIASSSTLQQ